MSVTNLFQGQFQHWDLLNVILRAISIINVNRNEIVIE